METSTDKRESKAQTQEQYESPRVVDLGTFAELTASRTVPATTDNGGLKGTI
jgi:hypothetical protein